MALAREQGACIGAEGAQRLDTLVTSDSLMRWYQALIAQKWTYARRRGPGWPCTVNAIIQLIVRMALENRSWGYTRIGHHVGRGTIANVDGECTPSGCRNVRGFPSGMFHPSFLEPLSGRNI